MKEISDSIVVPMETTRGTIHLWEWGADRPLCTSNIRRESQILINTISKGKLCTACGTQLRMGKGDGRWAEKRTLKLMNGVISL